MHGRRLRSLRDCHFGRNCRQERKSQKSLHASSFTDNTSRNPPDRPPPRKLFLVMPPRRFGIPRTLLRSRRAKLGQTRKAQRYTAFVDVFGIFERVRSEEHTSELQSLRHLV